MALNTKLHWHLYLGEESQNIDEDLLEYRHLNNHIPEEDDNFNIPQLIQEVTYVDYLSRNYNQVPNDIISLQDDVYNHIRVFHNRTLEIIQSSYDHLTNNSQLDEETYHDLLVLNGENVVTDPFLSRDEAYMLFNSLPQSYKYHLPHFARRDIVSKYDCFEKYWNKGMQLLCVMQYDIHNSNVDKLRNLLIKLNGKNNKFFNKYLGNTRGCFSLTEVSKRGKYEDILCFSGQSFKRMNVAIDTIAKSGRFKNPTVIKESDKVRYYICPERYVTYEDARKSKIDFEERMFSCCERKTFAEYDWHDVNSYRMIVKYQPCELCQWPIQEHAKKYKGCVKAGIKLRPLAEIAVYDAIAEEIYKHL